MTEQWRYIILMRNKAAEYCESDRQRVLAFNKQKRAAAVAAWPNDNPQAVADPREGGDGPQADDKVEIAKEKCHLWYVNICKFFCSF